MRIKIKELRSPPAGLPSFVGQEWTIKGWIRTVRNQKTFTFIEVNDGSTLSNFQIIISPSVAGYERLLTQLATGCSVSIDGLIVESPGKEQSLEMQASAVTLMGKCDPETYPMQKKKHTFEFLRTVAHLRSRTNTFGALTRIRNALAVATHQFFQSQGFLYIQTPIITGLDCEGAGKMFQVTTFDIAHPPKTAEGKVDYAQDFFARHAYLTVSGQLGGEVFACSMSDVYMFGPTFRAENSNTSRHLAEFWMIEPEMAFADINDNMDCAEAYLKFILKYLLDNCEEDMQFFDKNLSRGLIERLQQVIQTPFERVSYTYAVRVLEKADKKFEFPIKWGLDLQSEHERYLAEEFFAKPVIITDYPKEIKAFYMRANDDNKTVSAMDVLVPKVGEIIGGSQREERFNALEARMKEANLSLEDYWWYLELRKYGTAPHAGFGAGFERLIQFATGMENIRDVIPFPRYPGKADF